MIIGICGGTGSGKTTVANKILETIDSDSVALLQQDHYYKELADLPVEERARQNFDHPDSIDMELFVEHLRCLKNGQSIERPVYDFTIDNRSMQTVRVDAKPVVMVEGILIFENKPLRDLMDIKIFVDTDPDLRFIRRLRRDITERGRTVESVINRYLATVRPMHLEFVEPSKRYADVIIPEGGFNMVGIDLLTEKIRALLAAAHAT
ncbi:MAG: uridine kinase [Acidobacteriia bacterium]|nr:uridine kinase [Terriglobia bacterium]